MQKIEKIRVSIGSASVLGLKKIETDAPPTTCYVMTYSEKKCKGGCLFCPQGKNSDRKNAEKLSRVNWPLYDFSVFLNNLTQLYTKENRKEQIINNRKEMRKKNENMFSRLCIQVLNYECFFQEVNYIIKKVHQKVPNLKISTAIPPINKNQMKSLKASGLERICFALDACNKQLFEKIKGHKIGGIYNWDEHYQKLQEAISVFGRGYVSTYFIVGLGETEKMMGKALHEVIRKGILPGIFLLTPVRGTPMETHKRAPLLQFRHMQIMRYMMLIDPNSIDRFQFSDKEEKLVEIRDLDKKELHRTIEKQIAFKTAGCPACNRPYYTSRPGKEQDGYPRDLTKEERDLIFEELKHLMDTPEQKP